MFAGRPVWDGDRFWREWQCFGNPGFGDPGAEAACRCVPISVRGNITAPKGGAVEKPVPVLSAPFLAPRLSRARMIVGSRRSSSKSERMKASSLSSENGEQARRSGAASLRKIRAPEWPTVHPYAASSSCLPKRMELSSQMSCGAEWDIAFPYFAQINRVQTAHGASMA